MKTVYQGGVGQWAWLLHRLSGIGVLFFLVFHILDTALVLLGPDLYNWIIGLYRHPLFGITEIGLFAAVLFHALNGLRIIAVDFKPELSIHHKKLFKVVLILFFIIYIPVVIIMVNHILHGVA